MADSVVKVRGLHGYGCASSYATKILSGIAYGPYAHLCFHRLRAKSGLESPFGPSLPDLDAQIMIEVRSLVEPSKSEHLPQLLEDALRLNAASARAHVTQVLVGHRLFVEILFERQLDFMAGPGGRLLVLFERGRLFVFELPPWLGPGTPEWIVVETFVPTHP